MEEWYGFKQDSSWILVVIAVMLGLTRKTELHHKHPALQINKCTLEGEFNMT